MMPLSAPSQSQDLSQTNRWLLCWIERMTAALGQRSIAAPEDIAALFSELMRAGARLRAEALPAAGVDPEFDRQLEQYRCHVERLREFLPSIHGLLLEERARLEAQRARVRSATDWARTSRQTL